MAAITAGQAAEPRPVCLYRPWVTSKPQTQMPSSHSPLSVDKLGNAVICPVGCVGALDGRVGPNLAPHALHQLLQLRSCKQARGGSGLGGGWGGGQLRTHRARRR